MFLECLFIEFSAASFRALNELILIFHAIGGLLDWLLHNFLLWVCVEGYGLFLYFIGWGFVVIGRGFDLLFGLWFGFGLEFLLLFLDENTFLDWLLRCDVELRFFFVELGRKVKYKFQVSFISIAELGCGFSLIVIIFLIDESLSGGVWEIGFLGAWCSFDSAFEESSGGSSGHEVDWWLVRGLLL